MRDNPWTRAWGFDHPDPAEEKKRVATMLQVKDIMFPPEAAEALRTRPEVMGRRIITLRDMVM